MMRRNQHTLVISRPIAKYFFLLADKHICYKETGVRCRISQKIKILKEKRKFNLILWA